MLFSYREMTMCTKACSKVVGSQAYVHLPAFITDDAINDGCVCT